MIPNYGMFTYVGYTLGGALPTLYFAEGRYTQVHDNPNNVGWHPARIYHHRSNVLAATVDAYRNSAGVARQTFIANFFNNAYESNSPAARLFELSSNDNVNWTSHQSRSRLVRVGDPGFNPAYDDVYARNVLQNGHVAANVH